MMVASASRIRTGSANSSRWAAKIAASAALKRAAGCVFQFFPLGADRQQRLFQYFTLSHHVAGLVGDLEALGNVADQLADSQSRTGADTVQGGGEPAGVQSGADLRAARALRRARSASAFSSADRPRTVSCRAFNARWASVPRTARRRWRHR